MISGILSVIHENAEYDIERCLPFVIDGRGGAKLVHKLCRAYRRRGICALFLGGSAARLHEDLQRAGATFAASIEVDPSLLTAASKAEPFYDAVACRDLVAARRITGLLPGDFRAGEEYEEDYYFTKVLAGLVVHPTATDGIESLLRPFGQFAAASGDKRFDVCTALATGDNELFADAMDSLLQAREEEYSQAMAFEEITEDDYATEGQFFVEGLAIVRIAVMVGIRTEDDYLFIPSLAIESSAINLSPDSWKEMLDSKAGLE